MNIDFPKEHSHLLDKYNITKEPNKNKSFLLELDNIPELIYGINNKKDWFLAKGKGGLYEVEDQYRLILLQLSLNELYHKLDNVPYDFIIGNLKDEGKYLAPHPISGKITEWTPETAYEFVKKSEKIIPELEEIIKKDDLQFRRYISYFLREIRWARKVSYVEEVPYRDLYIDQQHIVSLLPIFKLRDIIANYDALMSDLKEKMPRYFVAITDENDKILVNTEGYRYIRYAVKIV